MLTIKHINTQIVLGLLDLNLFKINHPDLPKRELEKAGSIFAFKAILGDTFTAINYSDSGKPYLANRPEYISISHSHDYLAVMMNAIENTGIDIELVRDKVKHVKHKFLRDDEAKQAMDDVEKLIRYWSAKECLYKLHGLKGLDFITNLSVQDFDNNKIIGKITKHDYNKTFMLAWEKLGNYILVYSLYEI
ncbi:MAG: 4'-phosphopantetheinyl transferase superfamily protein [Bacteroidota bacterium]